MRKYIIILTIIAGLCSRISAQQDPHYSLYQFNGLFLNPAYAGSHDAIDIMAIYRAQWVGVEGAPMTGNASISSPLKRQQYALGLTLQGDRLGLTNSFGATGAFAYRIKVGKTKLALGVQAGITYYQQGNAKAQPDLGSVGINDNVFTVSRNMWLPNVGAGVYWYGKKFYAGFSVPHLLPTRLSTALGASDNSYIARQYNNYVLTAGYVIGRDISVVKVRPTMLVKYSAGLDRHIPDFDFGLGIFFADRVMIGANYRIGTDYSAKYGSTGVSGILMVQITHGLRAAYSYEYTLTQINKGTQYGSHDIMLGYEFNHSKKRFVSPRFVSYF